MVKLLKFSIFAVTGYNFVIVKWLDFVLSHNILKDNAFMYI
jgi:hypothetical protein